MKQIFQKKYEVHSYEVLINQKLNPVCLIDYMNDIAGHHSESFGYSMETLFKKEYSWIVLSWNICINKLPRLRDIVHIETWVSQVKRSFAYREFLIKDDCDEVLGKSSSLWLFYHITKQRPAKIPSELVDLWLINPEISCPESLIESDIFKEKDYQYKEIRYKVQKQDIDILDHVHNSRYIDWVIDSKPDVVKKEYSLKHLQISYNNEIKYPADITVKQKIFSQKDKTDLLIYDQIWNDSKQNISSEIATHWRLST